MENSENHVVIVSQRPRHSLIEAVVNTAIGFLLGLVTQSILFPMFGIHVPFSTNFAIDGIFTIISIARSYVVRRFFNAWLVEQAQAIAAALGVDRTEAN